MDNANISSDAARLYRERLLNDPYRPTYHFTLPDGNGYPADPNGAFFADGVYHVMYLYKSSRADAFHWGHISSVDLLHWRHHPDALTIENRDRGCFSGGAFVDDDKTAYITYWKFPSADTSGDNGGIGIAFSKPPYEKWERIYPLAVEANENSLGMIDKGVRDISVNGDILHVGCADPSNIWKIGDYYYLQAGNKKVLDHFGRGEDKDPYYSGDWTDLFRSSDLKSWEFLHRFYSNPHTDTAWPDLSEDDMCPSFLPLYDKKENGKMTEKHLQLFISHNRGCQYYVGELKKEKFFPELHGRMSWNDNSYFAPEALIDDRGRQLVWAWLLDDPDDAFERYGWCGVWSFPRTVWWDNGILRMSPVSELDKLQYAHTSPTPDEDGSVRLSDGDSFRLKAEIDMSGQTRAGFKVRVSDDEDTYTEIYYDKPSKTLVMDTSHCRYDKWAIKEEAPFELFENERLLLDIFVDRSVVEVYANERQAICRRVFPKDPSNALGVKYVGSPEGILKLDTWSIAPSNPY